MEKSAGGGLADRRCRLHSVTGHAEAASMARSHRIPPSSSYSFQSGFDRRRSPRCERMQLLCGHAEIYETAQPNNQAIGA